MRTLAIGDIHGCRKALETLSEIVGFTAEDTIVTLGDYVDRGPDSRGVIEFLIGLSRKATLVPLKGNHDIMMLYARQSKREYSQWTHPYVGGDATLASYPNEALGEIPQSHWDFLESCLPWHETEGHLFVHAGLDPDAPVEAQTDHTLYWERFPQYPVPHCSGKVVVCGHTAQASGLPLNFGHSVCIDTTAWNGGWLTCLDVDRRCFWQANEVGDTRMDVLSAISEED